MFAKRVEGRHSRGFVHVPGAMEKSGFLMILGSISLLGGTPRASRAALDDQVGSQVDFLMVFKCPGGVFWRPVISGQPWAWLWAILGALWR